MAEIGLKWASDIKGHVRLMVEEFSRVLKSSPKDGIQVETVRYRAHEQAGVRGVFHPAGNSSTARPGLIFVHGGAFTEGSRHRSTEIYPNVLYYFARHGIVGINRRLPPGTRGALSRRRPATLRPS